MVPSKFVWLDAMPLTPNGKLDRKALPPPMQEEVDVFIDQPPKTRLERDMAEIWEEVLLKPIVSIQSDFSDLGGDSLALLNLFTAIEARFGRRLTVDTLSGGLTIQSLVEQLSESEQQPPHIDPIVELESFGDLPPFFCIPGIGGHVQQLYRLAAHMGDKRPFLAFRRPAETWRTDTLGQMAAVYVAAMLRRQPAGPFYLGGHSFGTILAYEMAVQLHARGREVGRLIVIDQQKPGRQVGALEALPVLHRILAHIPIRLRYEWSQVPAAERFQHVRRLLLRWLKTAVGQQLDAASLFDVKDPKQTALFDSILNVVRNYQPKQIAVPITLFRAEVQNLSHLALDSTLGWRDFAKGQVRVHVIPGSHGSMMAEPMVRRLGKVLSDELDVSLTLGSGLTCKNDEVRSAISTGASLLVQ